MSKRVILITGANGGLGAAIAENFLTESPDNHVLLGVRNRRDRAEQIVNDSAGRAEIVSLDVTQSGAWKTTVEKVIATHARIDVLVNNAGGHQDTLLAQMSDAAWSEVLDSNLNAVFLGCRSVLPTMISQRAGRIVNIASLSALLAPAGQANYAAAKAGVVALTQSLAKEVARIGITVNAICPGFIETDATAGMPEAEKRAAQMCVPMRRFGTPAEVAAAVRFLACADAGYITGSAIKIDGGIL